VAKPRRGRERGGSDARRGGGEAGERARRRRRHERDLPAQDRRGDRARSCARHLQRRWPAGDPGAGLALAGGRLSRGEEGTLAGGAPDPRARLVAEKAPKLSVLSPEKVSATDR